MLKEAWKWFKYYCIIMKGLLFNKTAVTFLGTTYIISGNVVKRLGG